MPLKIHPAVTFRSIASEVPPRECSLLPFWFWNDDLSEAEIIRQIADFEAHGVYGFVIHPRVGLPRSLGWMSDGLLRFIEIAINEAARRDMKVILYDEGMYPSGSSSGQVVALNPAFACRGLARVDVGSGSLLPLGPDENLVAECTTAGGNRMAVIDRKVDAYIRGLHYAGDGPAEDEPPMSDILNSQATQAFIQLVYDRFAEAFGKYFGSTVIGIFTDEPNPLGKCREAAVRPGTTGILDEVNAFLGYDFTPHLPALWLDDEPDAKRFRRDYHRAIQRRLAQTWYGPLSEWCRSHGIALCGHPAEGDQLGVQRYFDIPGQDLVWRFVEPNKPSALEGPESTQAKCSSSAMIHLGRQRNSNEFCGAYGAQTTFTEMKWLADWCLVRGVNLLIPHAFYYSVRGYRRDERPPQLGPHSPWWDRFKPFADHCRRLCWINSECTHLCSVAILADPDHCPWRAAKICFQNQHDFNYVDPASLESAAMDSDGIRLAGMHYRMLIIDGFDSLPEQLVAKLQHVQESGRLVTWQPDPEPGTIAPWLVGSAIRSAAELVKRLDSACGRDVTPAGAAVDLRYRHVVKSNEHFYLFFNEGESRLQVSVEVGAVGERRWIDTVTGETVPTERILQLDLAPYETALLSVSKGG
jgi:hypothetical protein